MDVGTEWRFIHAFDLGSGAVKSTLVQLRGCQLGSLLQESLASPSVEVSAVFEAAMHMTVLFSDEVPVLLGEAVKGSADGVTIPPHAVVELISTSAQMRERGLGAVAAALQVTGSVSTVPFVTVVGVCTAVFRETTNGDEVLRKLIAACGCEPGSIAIASQASEALLGFRTGLAALAHDRKLRRLHPPNELAGRLIVWDSGASSFQLAAAASEPPRRMHIFEGSWGSSKALHAAVVEVMGMDWRSDPSYINTPNPMSETNFLHLVKLLQSSIGTALSAQEQHEKTAWLSSRLAASHAVVVAVGGINSMFRMCSLLLRMQGAHLIHHASDEAQEKEDESSFTSEDIRRALPLVLDKSDAEIDRLGFPQSNYLVPKLALAVAVMELLGLGTVVYKATVGCTLGLLVSPEMWAK